VSDFGPAPVEPTTDGSSASPATTTEHKVAPSPKGPTTKKARAPKHAVTAAAVGRRALGLVNYRWRRLGYRLVFAPGRVGIRAKTDIARRTITIYVRTTDTPQRIAHDIAHELGHALRRALPAGSQPARVPVLRNRPRAAPGGPQQPGPTGASGAG
jgi:hypothetical protein